MPLTLTEPDTLFEIVDGQAQDVPAMGAWAGTLANLLALHLNMVAFPKRLGIALVEVLFRLGPDMSSRRPDVAFVAADRWPASSSLIRDPAELDVVPNIAVEVNSPNNTAAEILDKLHDYFRAGVTLVWVIFPPQKQIYVYESPTQVRILQGSDELTADVLPAFRLKVADLFAVAMKP